MGIWGGGGGGREVGRSQPQPRVDSLNGSRLMFPGGWLRAPPLAVQPATASHPPPLPWARPAGGGGAGGREGARAWWTFLAPSRPRSLQRHGQKGHRVNPLLPGMASSRGLQGGFELGRIQVPPHPSADRGSTVLQGRVWGSRVLQGVLYCGHRSSQRLLLRVRSVGDRARVRDRVVPLSPRRGAAPPPPSVGGPPHPLAGRGGGAKCYTEIQVLNTWRNVCLRELLCAAIDLLSSVFLFVCFILNFFFHGLEH